MAKIKIEITIPSGLKDEPIIHMIGHKFKLIPNIIEASFSTSMGWAILTVEGERDELDRMLAFFKEKNIKVETQ